MFKHLTVSQWAWLILLVNAGLYMGFLPVVHVDEMRYVAVAWEMWRENNFLVPHINEQTYTHKPPLLFWLIQLTWWLLGVNDQVPRLVPLCFALGSMFLLKKLSRKLMPDLPQADAIVMLLFAGTLPFLLWSSLIMFDMMLVFWTLLGVLGTTLLLDEKPRNGLLMLALALAGGILSKGPVILVHILPVVVLAPWWHPGADSWRRFYLRCLMSLLLGVAIAMLWVIPAAIYGGDEYRQAILWGQTANRMVNSFAHQRPLWWYLPLLLLFFFPWLFTRQIWIRQPSDAVLWRLSVVWFGVAFVSFSLISGKQFHYLLPDLSPLLLIFARQFSLAESRVADRQWLLAGVFAVLAILVPVALYDYGQKQGVQWLDLLPLALLFLVLAGYFVLRRFASIDALLRMIALSMLILSMVIVLLLRPFAMKNDLSGITDQLILFQNAGVKVAHIGDKERDYDFIFRLPKSVPVLLTQEMQADFVNQHPDAVKITFVGQEPQHTPAIIAMQHYRDGWIVLQR